MIQKQYYLTIVYKCFIIFPAHFISPYNSSKQGERIMKLNAPTKNWWWISVILAIIGLIGYFVAIPFVSVYAFWFVVVGFVLLALSTVMKGM
jgi:hypothetical protein